jgi:hypothetical protein
MNIIALSDLFFTNNRLFLSPNITPQPPGKVDRTTNAGSNDLYQVDH